MIQIQIPEKAKYIIETIQNAGFEAYVVGGCVRDSILGRCPEDWDITTSARPEQVKTLFRRTIDTGIQHGTVTVMLDKEGFEVTTYRVDGKYEDSRHPKEVTFTPNLEEDLKRRDFTINAMAYNETEGLIDIFGGLKDIEAKLIRCVGNPEERFGEDALRIIREGGVLHNDTVEFYRSRYDSSACSIILYLMRRYQVSVPLRTQGWINERLTNATITDGRCAQLQFRGNKRSKCSSRFFDCMNELIHAVAA